MSLLKQDYLDLESSIDFFISIIIIIWKRDEDFTLQDIGNTLR